LEFKKDLVARAEMNLLDLTQMRGQVIVLMFIFCHLQKYYDFTQYQDFLIKLKQISYQKLMKRLV